MPVDPIRGAFVTADYQTQLRGRRVEVTLQLSHIGRLDVV